MQNDTSVTIHLSDERLAALGVTKSDPNISARVSAVMDRYLLLTKERPEFSQNQWRLIRDALRDWSPQAEDPRKLGLAISERVQTHFPSPESSQKLGLSRRAYYGVLAMLMTLRPDQTMAVVEQVEGYWRRQSRRVLPGRSKGKENRV